MTRGPAKQFDRDEVLGRAMGLFWAQGYEATGMSELLAHMSIGRQSLYDTFGGKKALYLEALGRYFEERLAMTRETLEAEGSPIGNLRRFFDATIAMSKESGYCGCFMGNTLAEFGRRDPEMEKALGRFFGRIGDLFTDTLRRARDAGELPAGAPVEDMARVLLATVQGLALFSKINPDPAISGRLMSTVISMLTGKFEMADEANREVS